MFPIDEHAKSGVLVWGLARSGSTMRKIKWDAKEPLPGAHWICNQGMIFDDDAFTHYLPVPLVENAGAMREALTFLVSAFDAGMLPNKNILDDARKVLSAVKRSPEREPEPGEEEKVEKVAAAIERELMTDEMLLADPTTLRKIKSQRIARAALKAMEVE